MPDRPIRWKSTRGAGGLLSLSEVISAGLATDGGLYVPERFEPALHASIGEAARQLSFSEFASLVLKPFFYGDPLERHLVEICQEAFDFPVILRRYGEHGPSVLELFHGPTAAFKDFGARFLARSLIRIRQQSTILVATSGDTGGAVASAFWNLPGCEVVVLFPEGRVSPRQQRQLTGWGGNIRAFAVRGTFDDCQRMVKSCFQDSELVQRKHLTSANSINAGRLLPQAIYYAWVASLNDPLLKQIKTDFIVPTGNLGNALSALWARELGFSIGSVTFATNSNRGLAELSFDGRWSARPTVATLANAMDVGNPSNLERVLMCWPDARSWAGAGIKSGSVDDPSIRASIVEVDRRYGEAICPHTATAFHLWFSQPKSSSASVIVATAHPAKFETIVEPLLGRTIALPERFAETLSRNERYEVIDSDSAALVDRL